METNLKPFQKCILVQDVGGFGFQITPQAWQSRYVEDLKPGPNTQLGPKDFFETASIEGGAMPYPIAPNQVKATVAKIVESWTGAPLNQAQQQVLDDFMEMEVRPLSGLELLDRMDTPTDILDWFQDFSQTRLQIQSCPLPCFGIR
jgi:hypothetical protein